MLRWMGKVILPLIFMFSFAGLAYGYGDARIGDTRYGESGVSMIDTELTLTLSGILDNGNALDRQGLLELLTQASDSHENTVDFVKILMLDAVSEMEAMNQMDEVSALTLSQTIEQSNINLVNIDGILTLASQVSQITATGGISIDVSVSLSAIASLLLFSPMSLSSDVTLQTQSDIADTSKMTMNSVTLLITQGNIDEAVQLITQTSAVLNAQSSLTTTSKVDWISMLGFGMSVQQSFDVTGVTYNDDIDLALASGIANAAGLEYTSSTELSAQAQIEGLIAQAIREGVLTLNAQGNYEVSAQLARIGVVLLNGIAQHTITFNQNLTVTMLLNAIATAVISEDIYAIIEIIRIQFDMKQNSTGFSIKQPTTDFDLNQPTTIFELKQSGE